ncbi:hypothetical protein G9H64_13145 [Aquirufa nivalisilvae]|uniref:hypothetical protein n=1 Tax=Aquirufa nivalisilvae TaxID=2516557 RepID=UPI0022A90B05|nr:hypothetical protein [Aquirufa nivalisilvae]MCZ2483907.1 hypothetical protein [Aquirufa nivalisilvae]
MESYTPVEDLEVAKSYLNYLKELDTYNKERRITIENKNSQLVGQASIVTSIFSLFIPYLVQNNEIISLFYKFFLILTFLFIYIHFLLSILHALNTLKINKYAYVNRSTDTITKINRAKNELEFYNEEISDLIFSINRNKNLDNQKGDNLIFSTRCFEIANIGFAILTMLILFSTFAIKKEIKEVKVSNLKEINSKYINSFNIHNAYPIEMDSSKEKKIIIDNRLQYLKK